MLNIYCYCLICIAFVAVLSSRRETVLTISGSNPGARELNFGMLFFVGSFYLIQGFRYLNYDGTDEFFYRMGSITGSDILNDALRYCSLQLSHSGIELFSYGQFYILITSFIWLVLILKGIYDYSDDVILTLVLLVTMGGFLASMNIIRQSIAAAILFCGYRYIKSGEFGKFLMVTIIAAGFHTSALILIPMFFVIRSASFYKRSPVYFIGGYIAVAIIMRVAFSMLKNTHYAIYFEKSSTMYGVGWIRILFYIIPGVLILLLTWNDDRMDSSGKNLIAIYIMICLISSTNVYLMRLNDLITPMIICEYTKLPGLFYGKYRPMVKYGFYIILLLFGLIEYSTGIVGPYHNILFEEITGILDPVYM